MSENQDFVNKGFRILLGILSPYVARELENEYKDGWWQKGVLDTLDDKQTRDLPKKGNHEELVASLDVQRCLLLFADVYWQNIFRKKLPNECRNWAKELQANRNKAAHIGKDDFSVDYACRALDTMSLFCEQLDPETAEKIREMHRTLRYGSADGSTSIAKKDTVAMPTATMKTKNTGILGKTPMTDLPSWRTVMQPHPDVAQGRYKKAEFAADLSQVARGEGSIEYRDPVEFFNRTFVTEGMSGLLEQALRRVSGKDGEPVIQLKTAFGGGKTHSMLALYHLLRGRISLDKIPQMKPVLERAGTNTLPKTNVAVVVGTALDPAKSKRPNYMPGITINTLWGEIAAQLAESSGNPKLYEFVKEADKKGISPGSEALKNLFNACGPCLILMDELVSYAKRIYGVSGLPAGSFDNFISFIQEITEAARASENSLVVASIPESELEIGGEAGKKALETIEHTFGRMESIWKPVAANEGFEVVRRRLFLDCDNPDARKNVCRAFGKMYSDNSADFPLSAKELEYQQRLEACYPIHPEVFDRLYEDWSTLERFQRTRGVLRLMAAVIHELWMGNDAGLMIMPGSISLDVPAVRDELTRYLSEGWNAIVDGEVDGKSSIPFKTDQDNPRYGKNLASRRVARTIMLGSAPTDRSRSVRGVETSRIRLGVVQPGETIADFNDALNTLETSLTYLYADNSRNRYWYDTRPTLRKTVEDRAMGIKDSEVEHEIEIRLRKLKKENPFAGLHPCPDSSSEVPDEQNARLVILGPNDGHKNGQKNSAAQTAVDDILNNRGNSPRIYRNTLAFMAPDLELIQSVKQEVRRLLAWRSIEDDSERLNLDAAQNKEVSSSLKRCEETVELRIKEAYCWLFVPYIDRNVDIKTIEWDVTRLSGGNDGIVMKAAKSVGQSESVIPKWAPALLMMELEKVLWTESNDISIKQLWEYLCTYCYLPRLTNYRVLEECIHTGLNSPEYFAIASAFSNERYTDLRYNQPVGDLNSSDLLVKVPIAKQQQRDETQRVKDDTDIVNNDESDKPQPPTGTARKIQEQRKETHFSMSAQLDPTRINRDVQRLVEEVIGHLASIDGAQMEVFLEVGITAENGIPPQIIRTVSENCRTLKVKDFGFEG